MEHKGRSARFVRLRILGLIAEFLLLGSASFLSARAQSSNRPKIGLVFSGGSALGLAHIGVLKYFEEHHIPV